jgi:hypothetical protein
MGTPSTHPNQAAIDEITQWQQTVEKVHWMLQFTKETSATDNWPKSLQFRYESVERNLVMLSAELQLYKNALWLDKPKHRFAKAFDPPMQTAHEIHPNGLLGCQPPHSAGACTLWDGEHL